MSIHFRPVAMPAPSPDQIDATRQQFLCRWYELVEAMPREAAIEDSRSTCRAIMQIAFEVGGSRHVG